MGLPFNTAVRNSTGFAKRCFERQFSVYKLNIKSVQKRKREI